MTNPIIVIGDGCTGLALAAALSRSCIRVLLIGSNINRTAGAQKEERGTRLFALSDSSCKLLQSYKIVNDFNKIAQPINMVLVNQYGSDSTLNFLPSEANLENFGYMIEEGILQNKMLQAIEQSTLVEYIQKDICDIKQNENAVLLRTADGVEYQSELLVIADGKYSKSRELLEFTVSRKFYQQKAFTFDVEHTNEHCGIAFEHFLQSGPFAVLPKKGGLTSSIVWTVGSDIPIDQVPLDLIQDLLNMRSPDYLGKVKMISTVKKFPLQLSFTQLPYKNRVVLVGDAYRSIHPIAGQGLNLALRDVGALAKLVLSTKLLGLDVGSQKIVEDYYDYRRLDSSLMRYATDGLNSFFQIDSRFLHKIRGLGLAAVNSSSYVKSIFSNYASGHVPWLKSVFQFL